MNLTTDNRKLSFDKFFIISIRCFLKRKQKIQLFFQNSIKMPKPLTLQDLNRCYNKISLLVVSPFDQRFF